MKPSPQRYSAHTALPEIGSAGQRAVRSATVAVVGAGGLGSAALLYLAGAGVGTLRVIDPDTVTQTNLPRQIIHTENAVGMPKAVSAARAIAARNSEVKVEAISLSLTPDNYSRLLAGADVVLDCTDNFLTRMLIDEATAALGIPYVYGAVARYSAHVFSRIPGSAGYRDIFGTAPSEPPVSCSVRGVFSPVVGVVGTLQAAETLKLITGAGEPLVNRLLTVDLLTMDFQIFPVAPSTPA